MEGHVFTLPSQILLPVIVNKGGLVQDVKHFQQQAIVK